MPSLEPSTRYTNFFTEFDEDQPLSAFERWMVYLDYSIVKSDEGEERQEGGEAAEGTGHRGDQFVAATRRAFP